MQPEKHIAVKREIFYEMIQHCMKSSPRIAFGMLAGRETAIEVVEMMSGLEADRSDPTNEMIECMETKSRLLGRGHRPLAIFRCHASGNAAPTQYEIETYSDPNVMLFIVSLQQGGVPLVKAYEIAASQARLVRIEVE